MSIASTASLVDTLRQHRLLDPEQLEELKSFQDRFLESKALAGDLIQRGWLTPYQANQLLNGKGQELVLGSHILLERLGEGGMGQVFKARHRNLGRISAIKLIRKERLDNPNAVRRFQREVRSAAALSHPNIVRAYDADEIAGTHLLVMEYVEGAIDLAKLVKKHGPLPVPHACDCIRQAAMGLQHASERGMVHRDIKPANLLLTAGGKTVKVLDMGLARLDHPSEDDDDKSSTMTLEGAVMGTPDYIAPEQALDTHTVDIRADLYSLGCTFYYLLTGRVPFPGGTLLQKLNKHQNDQPMPVEKLRPEVSPEVALVVRKLMAKKPGDRFQTPAELVVALAALSSQGDQSAVAAIANDLTIAERVQPEAIQEVGRDTLASAFSYMEKRDDTIAFALSQKKPKNRHWLLVGTAVGSLFFIGLVVMLVLVFTWSSEKKQPEKETHPFVAVVPPKKLPAKVDQAWLNQVAAMPAEKQVEAVAAKLKELNPGFDGKVTHGIGNGVVTNLTFLADNLTDISPVRALKNLNWLNCNGSGGGKGKLSDLSPLKGMPLTALNCDDTQVADLSPLKGMPLTSLTCGNTKVSDLSPLKDMKLTYLWCRGIAVSDLSLLKGMPLTSLECSVTKVSDLSPLKDMKLTYLWFYQTQVSDLSPLKGMPIHDLACDFKPYRDTEILRSIKTLEKINNKAVAVFWKDVNAQQAAFEAWCTQVAAMPADKQVDAVAAKLKELNPGFDGKVAHKKEGDVVTGLTFLTDKVTDISPLRALRGLNALDCQGSDAGKGMLADLSPLRDMKLTNLICYSTQVSDLSPLKGMPLTGLACGGTQVSDLSPLKGMPLGFLDLGATKVSDLSPLKDVKLRLLFCHYTQVADLSPLKDMKLTDLGCQFTQVADLSPLKDMKLTSVDCHFTRVSDLSPLKGMPLMILYCDHTPVADLSPLQGMPLKNLHCDFMADRDAKILRSITSLEKINDKESKQFWKELTAKEKP
jgi:serine/threonine protein kinase/Leucine-rich repeat (LRR) protein